MIKSFTFNGYGFVDIQNMDHDIEHQVLGMLFHLAENMVPAEILCGAPGIPVDDEGAGADHPTATMGIFQNGTVVGVLQLNHIKNILSTYEYDEVSVQPLIEFEKSDRYVLISDTFEYLLSSPIYFDENDIFIKEIQFHKYDELRDEKDAWLNDICIQLEQRINLKMISTSDPIMRNRKVVKLTWQ